MYIDRHRNLPCKITPISSIFLFCARYICICISCMCASQVWLCLFFITSHLLCCLYFSYIQFIHYCVSLSNLLVPWVIYSLSYFGHRTYISCYCYLNCYFFVFFSLRIFFYRKIIAAECRWCYVFSITLFLFFSFHRFRLSLPVF